MHATVPARQALLTILSVSACLSLCARAGSLAVEELDLGDKLTQEWIVTSPPPDAPNSHVFDSPDNSAFGVDLQGVSRIFLDTDPTGGLGSRCSGSLLWTGRHILTAAHCVTDASGNIDVIFGADGNDATFDTAAGDVTLNIKNGGVHPHPNYDGDALHGFDVAVLELESVAPSAVTRYDINRAFGTEIDTEHVKVGYGRYGNGSDGHDGTNGGFDGSRRAGKNEWEDDGLGGDPGTDFRTNIVTGITNNTTQLTFDFDSGDAANDAFFQAFPAYHSADLGFGTDEVNTAPGDSGGPTFIAGTPLHSGTLADYIIGGVTSYGLTFSEADFDTDISGDQPDSSWGEFSVDARTAHDDMFTWIDATVPEPSALALFVLATTAALAAGRRR